MGSRHYGLNLALSHNILQRWQHSEIDSRTKDLQREMVL